MQTIENAKKILRPFIHRKKLGAKGNKGTILDYPCYIVSFKNHTLRSSFKCHHQPFARGEDGLPGKYGGVVCDKIWFFFWDLPPTIPEIRREYEAKKAKLGFGQPEAGFSERKTQPVPKPRWRR